MISEERFRLLLRETEFRADRSSGAGGQHVNKVSTKITLSFSIPASRVLTEEEKGKLLSRLGSKLTSDGVLIIRSGESRSQVTNKEEAKQRFMTMLNAALRERKKRKATRPSKGSKEKRIQDKKHRGEVKRWRGKGFE